jgi:hypothetical protein
VATVNLVAWARGSHPLLYGTMRRGPPTANGLSAPDQGASQGPIRPLGLIGGRSIPTALGRRVEWTCSSCREPQEMRLGDMGGSGGTVAGSPWGGNCSTAALAVVEAAAM